MEKFTLPKVAFVTGTDTDAGKSYATGWLAKKLIEFGESAITQKFIQTGNKDFSEDIDVHRRIMGCGMLPRDLDHTTAPIILSYPASADLAARIDNTEIDVEVADKATAILASEYDHVLVEGAGGLMAPIKGEYLALDYLRYKHIPAIVVTNSKLGSINHTLLTLKALASEGVEVAAVVFNPYFDTDEFISKDTREYLRKWVKHHHPDTLWLEMPSIL